MNNKQKLFNKLIASLIVVSMSACAASASGGRDLQQSSTNLSDSKGMSYYVFDKDTKGNGQSACYGGCAINWPAVPASASNGADFDSIERKDGSRQLVYKDSPVYYFAGDAKSGDRNGDGLGGVWHLIQEKPKAAAKKAYQSNSYGSYGSSY